MVNPRFGSQSPTFMRIGPYAYSDGDEAVEMFRGYGATFFPCQEDELEYFLARNEDGTCAAMTIGISKPRQNGKSYGARYYALWEAMIEGKRVLYSAHHGRTVRKQFRLLRDIVKGQQDFKRELVPGDGGIYSAAGSEGIYFANGGCIEFQTRTASAGRGDTYDIIILDEAQELTEEEIEAIKPTSLASDSGDPQMIYLGTPPGPKCPGTVFRSMHDKAHEGRGSEWWLEWAASAIPDMSDVDSVLEIAYATNPALGYKIRERVMREAITTATSADGFAREYLGWWSLAALIDAALDAVKWAERATATPPNQVIVSFGVKFSLDGKRAAIAACIKGEDGNCHVEVVGVRSTSRGVSAIANYLCDRKKTTAQITVDGKAKADVLERRLRERKLPKRQVKVCQPKDVQAACSAFEDAVESGSVTHFDQPGLNDSVAKSSKRKIGPSGGWAFDGENPLPVEACALAHYGAITTKRNPNKKARIG